jgi:hypothetical protein
MDDLALATALDSLKRTAADPAAFCLPFLEMFPVSGASVSTVGDVLGSETISASDSLAARVDELQFDLGEGPCWDAMNLARPILEPDLRTRSSISWPAFLPAILDEQVSALFAFPLTVGPLRIGAVDLYSIRPVSLDSTQSRQAAAMADEVGKHVLRQALQAVAGEREETDNAYSRRLVHQATGMVLAQLRVPADEARLIIQGHAFAAGRSMMEVAQDIVERRLSFLHGERGIEVSE